jgi:hypothetical protein
MARNKGFPVSLSITCPLLTPLRPARTRLRNEKQVNESTLSDVSICLTKHTYPLIWAYVLGC